MTVRCQQDGWAQIGRALLAQPLDHGVGGAAAGRSLLVGDGPGTGAGRRSRRRRDGPPVHGDHVEACGLQSGGEGLLAGVTHHLAGGRLGEAPLGEQNDREWLNVVVAGDRVTHDREDLLGAVLDVALGLDLLEHDEDLLVRDVDRDGRSAPGADLRERGPGLVHGLLDVLRVEIPAADDQEILPAPRDEQLAVQGEAEVARPQEGAVVGAGDPRLEGLGGQLGAAPVPRGDVPGR